MRPTALPLLVLVNVIACPAPRAREATVPPRPPASLSAPRQPLAPSPARVPAGPDPRDQTITRMARVLERVRGLPLRQPLDVTWADARTMRRHLRLELEQDTPADYAEAYVATLARVGLLPPRYPLRQALLSLMDEQVAGFYDPRTRRLLVRKDMPAGELILSHEVAHALQDQSFPLRPLQGERKDQDDRSFAVRALVEGDATLTMVEYLRQSITLWKAVKMIPDLLQLLALDDAKIKAAPAYVRESLVQPYLKGLAFVQALHGYGGRALVNQAFADPPASSEQVLHPEKYFVRELPAPVRLPDLRALVGSSTGAWHENTLGEFGVAVLLGQTLGASRAEAAARGWGGDRLHGYRCWRACTVAQPRPGALPCPEEPKVLLVWLSRWDTNADAQEFARALSDHLDVRYPRARRGRPFWRVPGGLAEVRLRRRSVLLVDGALDPRQAKAIARACGL